MRILRGHTRRDERGAVAIIISSLMVVVVGILAFTVDFGLAYSNQRYLQNAADAAVLAAGGVILEESNSGDDCDSMIADTPAVDEPIDKAKGAASSAFANNAPSGSSLDALSFSCDDSTFDNNVVISATGTMDSPGIFGVAYGQDKYALAKPAKSMIGPAGKLVGLRPFALCEDLAEIADSDPDAILTIDFSNADAGCGTAAGNFGILDFNNAYTPPAGPPDPGCPGSSEVEVWIADGYPGMIPSSEPLLVEGRPGTPSQNFRQEFNEILDEPIIIPTYELLTENGCNSIYQIERFVEVMVCGYKLNPDARTEGDCFEPALAPSDHTARFVQIQFTRFIAIGELNLSCDIDTCADDPLLLKLVD